MQSQNALRLKMNVGKKPLIIFFCVCVSFSFLAASMSGCAKTAKASLVQEAVCVDCESYSPGFVQRNVSVNRSRVFLNRPLIGSRSRRVIVVDGYQGSSEPISQETVEVKEVPAELQEVPVIVDQVQIDNGYRTYERNVEVRTSRRRIFPRRRFFFRRCR